MSDFEIVKQAAAGAYVGEFVGVEPVDNDYGQGLKWSWKITAGEHSGRVPTRITGRSATAKNACGKMIDALMGRPLAEGDGFKPKEFVGRKYTVIVSAGEKGGTRVETVAPL